MQLLLWQRKTAYHWHDPYTLTGTIYNLYKTAPESKPFGGLVYDGRNNKIFSPDIIQGNFVSFRINLRSILAHQNK